VGAGRVARPEVGAGGRAQARRGEQPPVELGRAGVQPRAGAAARPDDRGRLGAWAGQVLADVEAKDAVGVREDAAILDAIWARMRHSVAGTAGEATIDAELSALRAAAKDKRLEAASAAADKVRAALATL